MKFGIIGGSGLYEMEGLTEIESHSIKTPFGTPSDNLIRGKLFDKDVVFLPRHGKGHRVLPSEINYRANIWAMKSLGVTHLISVSAVGSLKEEMVPGEIVIVDQFFDRTKDRPSTFFGNGIVAHIPFGTPVCMTLSQKISEAARSLSIKHHFGGTYVCMEGPIFSTRVESEFYRMIGASVIGMTNLQEAKLAREAEICFASMALCTDYDCWHQTEEEVSLDSILEVMRHNIENSRAILKELIQNFPESDSSCADHSALENCIMTSPGLIPQKVKQDLDIIVGKYLK